MAKASRVSKDTERLRKAIDELIATITPLASTLHGSKTMTVKQQKDFKNDLISKIERIVDEDFSPDTDAAPLSETCSMTEISFNGVKSCAAYNLSDLLIALGLTKGLSQTTKSKLSSIAEKITMLLTLQNILEDTPTRNTNYVISNVNANSTTDSIVKFHLALGFKVIDTYKGAQTVYILGRKVRE